MPWGQWELGGDYRRSAAISLFEDFEQIVTGASVEGFEAEVVENVRRDFAISRPSQRACAQSQIACARASLQSQLDQCLAALKARNAPHRVNARAVMIEKIATG